MLLYHNKFEYSRVVETVEVIEDGMFVKDQTPDDHGGAVLQVELVHRITFTDTAGCVEILHLDNRKPLGKNKEQSGAAITLDGEPYKPGATPARVWTTVKSTHLTQAVKTKAEITLNIMLLDGLLGTPT